MGTRDAFNDQYRRQQGERAQATADTNTALYRSPHLLHC